MLLVSYMKQYVNHFIFEQLVLFAYENCTIKNCCLAPKKRFYTRETLKSIRIPRLAKIFVVMKGLII